MRRSITLHIRSSNDGWNVYRGKKILGTYKTQKEAVRAVVSGQSSAGSGTVPRKVPGFSYKALPKSATDPMPPPPPKPIRKKKTKTHRGVGDRWTVQIDNTFLILNDKEKALSIARKYAKREDVMVKIYDATGVVRYSMNIAEIE